MSQHSPFSGEIVLCSKLTFDFFISFQAHRHKVAVEVQEVKRRKAKPALEGLRFGTAFTDHMLTMEWGEVGGWQAPRIVPQGPLAIHPGATVLQYAQVQVARSIQISNRKYNLFRAGCL